MPLKIVDALEAVVRATPDVQSILVLDKDGVPIVSAGDEIRNKGALSSCYNCSIDHVRKLGLGEQLFWLFTYEQHQLMLLNLRPFTVYVVANAQADPAAICEALPSALSPVLAECETIIKEVVMIP